MAATRATRRQPARLSFEDGEVVVTPRDRDIFLISAEKATEACRDAVKLGERIERFQTEFLVPLHDWCVRHADRVHACYLAPPVGHLQVFLVTTSPRYDFNLGEEIATFERELAASGWQVGVSQLPGAGDDSLGTFFSPDGALEVYAQQGTAPHESGSE
jgi:hypothetical protein